MYQNKLFLWDFPNFCCSDAYFLFNLRSSLNPPLQLFCYQVRNSSAHLAPDKTYKKETFIFDFGDT